MFIRLIRLSSANFQISRNPSTGQKDVPYPEVQFPEKFPGLSGSLVVGFPSHRTVVGYGFSAYYQYRYSYTVDYGITPPPPPPPPQTGTNIIQPSTAQPSTAQHSSQAAASIVSLYHSATASLLGVSPLSCSSLYIDYLSLS